CMRSRNLPHHNEEFRGVPQRAILVDMPSFFHHFLHQITVVINFDLIDVSRRMAFVRHLDKELVAQSNKLSSPNVTINFWELGMMIVDNVLDFELSAVLVKAISDEYWDIIEPSVSRSRGQ